MSTSIHTVSSSTVGTGTFKVYDKDEFIGQTFRDGSWWEDWMHPHMKNAIQNNCRDGEHILDIGANIGSHTVAFSKMGPNQFISAFEPQKHIFDTLDFNVSNNALSNVKTYGCALSDAPGQLQFPKYNVDEINNQGGMSLSSENEGETVDLKVLDTVMNDENVSRVCVVKIDVEGHEKRVFKGADKILTVDKPVIFLEDHTGENVEFLRNKGYCVSKFNEGHNDYIAKYGSCSQF